jgi:hypothetical protein
MESPHPDFSSGRTCNEKREEILKKSTAIAFQKKIFFYPELTTYKQDRQESCQLKTLAKPPVRMRPAVLWYLRNRYDGCLSNPNLRQPVQKASCRRCTNLFLHHFVKYRSLL